MTIGVLQDNSNGDSLGLSRTENSGIVYSFVCVSSLRQWLMSLSVIIQ